MLFTKLMDALFSSYTNLGSKLPKNDATITRKKDDATAKTGFIGSDLPQTSVLLKLTKPVIPFYGMVRPLLDGLTSRYMYLTSSFLENNVEIQRTIVLFSVVILCKVSVFSV